MENISEELKFNVTHTKNLFGNTIDFTTRELEMSGTKAVLFIIDGLVNKEHISISVLNPIMTQGEVNLLGNKKMDYYASNVLASVEQINLYKISEIVEKLMAGFAVLLLDGCNYAIAFGTQGFDKRPVQEPTNETMQRGSKEGFTEAYLTNVSLIRRRMKTTDLQFERLYIGSQSKTPVAICYLQSQVSGEILAKLKKQIEKCDLKTIMAAGYLSGYLKRSSIFGNVGLTERPDVVCGKITEGRVAIIIDGTPTAIIVPYLFIENFQTLDDYANRPFYSTFIRWIKYIAFIIAVFLPGIYVAVIVHRPELLPDALLMTIATEEAKTPFSVIWELILVNFLYEIMREAGLRAPKALSQSVSIVGALVIGDTAVQSGLISAPSLMAIAAAAIAGYAIPKLYEQVSVLRLVLILIGGFFGTWGLVVATVFLIYNICDEENFGIPVTAPVTPFDLKSMEDVIIRAPWRKLSKRTQDVQNLTGTKYENK